MSSFDERPPPLPSSHWQPPQNELDQFKAKWSWIGWQILKWTPIALITVGILGAGGPVLAAAFLGIVVIVAWSYKAGRLSDLAFWSIFSVLTVCIAIFGFQIFDAGAVSSHLPELLGSLFFPMILTLGGRKNPRVMRVAVILAMAAYSIGLYQITASPGFEVKRSSSLLR